MEHNLLDTVIFRIDDMFICIFIFILNFKVGDFWKFYWCIIHTLAVKLWRPFHKFNRLLYHVSGWVKVSINSPFYHHCWSTTAPKVLAFYIKSLAFTLFKFTKKKKKWQLTFSWVHNYPWSYSNKQCLEYTISYHPYV